MIWNYMFPWKWCRTAGLHEHDKLARSVLDAVGANLAVLDRCGMITVVNGAWLEFARENGDTR